MRKMQKPKMPKSMQAIAASAIPNANRKGMLKANAGRRSRRAAY